MASTYYARAFQLTDNSPSLPWRLPDSYSGSPRKAREIDCVEGKAPRLQPLTYQSGLNQ